MTPAPTTSDVVLVADDDPDIRTLVEHTLRREGLEVIAVADGLEALEAARERQPDLMVLDVSMPGASGFDVCRTLAAVEGETPPVIFLTAHGHTSAVVEGLDLGAVDYMVKPFRTAELAARVRGALRTRRVISTLAEQSSTDGLTGVLTRRRLDERALAELELAQRNDLPLTCVMIDLDHFKEVNDRLGHVVGDELLRRVAAALRRLGRASDVVGRYGGDEFCVILPGTDLAGAAVAARRLREALTAIAGHVVDRAPDVPVGVSMGIAELSETMLSPADLYDAADRALYHAKGAGRNQTAVLVHGNGEEARIEAVAA